MKVAISTNGTDLSGRVDQRFGRCSRFLIVETDTMDFEVVPNEAGSMAHGAGVTAARIVVSRGVDAVITGNVGPNAFRALSASNVRVFTRVSGTINEALSKFVKDELTATSKPNVGGHFGGGGGGGRRGGVRGSRSFPMMVED